MARHFRVAILLTLVGLPIACDRPKTEQAPTHEPTVKEFFAAIDAGKLDRVRELVTDDLALHVLGVPQALSKDALLEAIQTFYAAFPDNTHIIEQTLEADDRIAVMLTQHATSKGTYEGAAPTGQRVTIPAIHIMRFSDGRIREWWALEDNLGLMQQLGMELRPKAPTGTR
jgi:steroid delta-isomerase-like uncharacterized protein